jgi:uncharacterized surface protein with fasciclin (FAS1) repeats
MNELFFFVTMGILALLLFCFKGKEKTKKEDKKLIMKFEDIQKKPVQKKELNPVVESIKSQIKQTLENNKNLDNQLKDINITALSLPEKVNFNKEMTDKLDKQEKRLQILEKEIMAVLKKEAAQEIQQAKDKIDDMIPNEYYNQQNLYTELLNNPMLRTFSEILKRTTLGVDLVNDKYTILAPSSAAWNKVDKKMMEELLQQENRFNLNNLLKNHFIEGAHFKTELNNILNLNKLLVDPSQFKIEHEFITKNGIIYVIDNVIMSENINKLVEQRLPETLASKLLRVQPKKIDRASRGIFNQEVQVIQSRQEFQNNQSTEIKSLSEEGRKIVAETQPGSAGRIGGENDLMKRQATLDTSKILAEIGTIATAINLLNDRVNQLSKNYSISDIQNLRNQFDEYKIKYNGLRSAVQGIDSDLKVLQRKDVLPDDSGYLTNTDILAGLFQTVGQMKKDFDTMKQLEAVRDPMYAIKKVNCDGLKCKVAN